MRECRTKKTRRHRKGPETLLKRRFKKLVESQEWFRVQEEEEQEPKGVHQYLRFKQMNRKPGNNKRVEAVYFCPYTPEGALRSELMKEDEALGLKRRVKVVEYMERTMSQNLAQKDPWNEHCGRDTCFPCQKTPGRCMRQGAIYLMECRKCQEVGRNSYYVGETARTPYDRGLEHLTAVRKKNPDSPLVEHDGEHHQNGQEPDFTMSFLENPRTNLLR